MFTCFFLLRLVAAYTFSMLQWGRDIQRNFTAGSLDVAAGKLRKYQRSRLCSEARAFV
ncbi:hypothetical protein SBA6_1270010 [Candidatus Sulfopaludibacter sp. SbA6]|nr:hypothetical protein SBA6_1270010 [Candidatus Sulfopaludibacter sp. SbA6]